MLFRFLIHSSLTFIICFSKLYASNTCSLFFNCLLSFSLSFFISFLRFPFLFPFILFFLSQPLDFFPIFSLSFHFFLLLFFLLNPYLHLHFFPLISFISYPLSYFLPTIIACDVKTVNLNVQASVIFQLRLTWTSYVLISESQI